MPAKLDLTGQTFAKLAVVKASGKDWLCKCECGGKRVASARALRAGLVKTCGCVGTGRPALHGFSRTREYRAWAQAQYRCQPSHPRYADYGGRGIKVCKRWRDSFEIFLLDMGPCPKGYQLDRFPDNDGDYEPGNCRWASPKENMNNRRCSVNAGT